MLKRLASWAIRMDNVTSRISPASDIRWIIPYVKLPKYDNREVFDKCERALVELKYPKPYAVIETFIDANTRNYTSHQKLAITGDKIVNERYYAINVRVISEFITNSYITLTVLGLGYQYEILVTYALVFTGIAPIFRYLSAVDGMIRYDPINEYFDSIAKEKIIQDVRRKFEHNE